jgi:hypothetical protein
VWQNQLVGQHGCQLSPFCVSWIDGVTFGLGASLPAPLLAEVVSFLLKILVQFTAASQQCYLQRNALVIVTNSPKYAHIVNATPAVTAAQSLAWCHRR